MCEALYPLHAASDIDSCMTNRAWMPQYDEPHVRGHHVDFGSESEVVSDEDDSEDHDDSYAEDDDDSDQDSWGYLEASIFVHWWYTCLCMYTPLYIDAYGGEYEHVSKC